MVKVETKVEDVEEGEISDTASVEEISEEDFIKEQDKVEIKVVKDSKPKGVWTVQDLYKFGPISGRFASSLCNLAWAQAVQNKPLNDIFVAEQDDNSKRSSPSSSVASVNSKEDKGKEVVVVDNHSKDKIYNNKVCIDVSGDDMEEGELEEGEIDLDVDSSEVDLEKRVCVIRQALESVSAVNAEKSFEGVCLKLQRSFESLREVVSDISLVTKEANVQLLFTAIENVHSVFCSMEDDLKEQNKGILSRLISLVKSHDPPLFSPEQLKEIDVMSIKGSEKDQEVQINDAMKKKCSDTLAKSADDDLTSASKLPSAVNILVDDKPNMSQEVVKSGLYGFRGRGRGVLVPLLDLHKDHDEDSLPSPTRETSHCSIPIHKALAVGDGMIKSGLPTTMVAEDKEDSKLHPYETDAVKAVSTYQQKFGRSSFFMSTRLPSPTPSEESGEGDGDIGGEVSSTSNLGGFKPVNHSVVGVPIVSGSPQMDASSMEGLTTTRSPAPVSSPAPTVSGSNPTMKPSAKSRDPRLRYVNSDVSVLDLTQRPLHLVHNAPKVELGSRKQKTVEDPILDGPALKRQKSGSENSGLIGVLKTTSGNGGWLEDTDMVGTQLLNKNVVLDPRKVDVGVTSPSIVHCNTNVGNEPLLVTSSSSTASLPALLKDIAVNPTMLINILKMGQQQRLPAEVQQKSTDSLHPPTSNSLLGAVPSVNFASSNPSRILPKPAGTLPTTPQTSAMDDPGKIRMKPRDPRRVLHGNALQRSGSLGSEKLKMNVPSTSSFQKDNLNAQKLEGQAETKPMPSLSIPQPDITRLFTKNLKNINDIMSVSQPLIGSPNVTQNLESQPAQIKADRVDVKAIVSNSEDPRTGTVSASEVGAAGPARPQHAWGDVEHLFEGYDDQQKAAIQRERARRLEEQNKMFAAHKLCLVLDLDHTLLNSAKFVEVDPVHDEILRKKEEQDREKLHRHLFRFPHMGMWTKLRPGIWNFLERASKLFELHLYTMGNKLYATEMAKVLDPKGVLFAGRVISRGDDGDPFDGDERVPKSKDLEGVLGMESAVVIIDDSVRVWPHNKLNLIVVERYTYFPCSRRQFGLPGPSLLEIDHDERPEDGTLASALTVIERIHQIFFSYQPLGDVDVRNILASEQQKILDGCRILFSRVFPVGEANPHLHPLWQTAEQFGAVCTNQIDEQVTHVVANSLGTDKVNWALSTGRFVVYPGWVEASALLYRRANEQDFGIKL
ncbi:BRCT domain-containing protein/NIF domain-containing protein [Cephalotus follicularis]|uniref:protein-serine/threonine phosphatase n=1 Tax=Cephalotus follicularis TaxID=3775 RepID=A0A1Q3BU34_CEPFO|nr:BRCT domain-containing protein/NIF domain-containing protein [Cephalotus follicularis]